VLTLKQIRTFIVALAALCMPSAMILSACADGETGVDGNANQPTTSSSGGEGGVCLVNSCTTDAECAGCSDGRTDCLEAEGRCVACDPNTGQGCAPGEICTSFGLCAPANQNCPTDNLGNPTITCSSNADCLACSPMNQVCDVASGKCVACTPTNTQHCLASDICVDGNCSPKCPTSCNVDNDCMDCGGPGNEAHACNNHKCAECSDTYPCPAGLTCESGTCIAGCGQAGEASGVCYADEDCAACGGTTGSPWVCKKPINANGPMDAGQCGPTAAGCSDLGTSVAVLPPPFDSVTNLCSDDADCSGVGIIYSVSTLIKDIIGSDSIDVGFATVDIQDANVTYGMNSCASIDITENISCGVCVPCKTDEDCDPIAIDPLMGDLFKGDPLATIAASLLVDLIWGNNPDHNLHFFCQPVAAGYGVCAPCGNPMQSCHN
jgi:hypothetical protein